MKYRIVKINTLPGKCIFRIEFKNWYFPTWRHNEEWYHNTFEEAELDVLQNLSYDGTREIIKTYDSKPFLKFLEKLIYKIYENTKKV